MLIVSYEKVKCLSVIFLITCSLSFQNLKSQQPVNSVTAECIESNSFSFDPNSDRKSFNFLKSSVGNGTPFKDDIYSIVFVSSGGFRGVEQNEIKRLPVPKRNSIEYAFSKTKFDYAFLDFKKNKCDWLNQGIFMAPFFDRYFFANWSDIYSGIVYIRDMKPNYSYR